MRGINNKNSVTPIADMTLPEGFGVLGEKYFNAMNALNYSPLTLDGKRYHLRYFAQWCEERSIYEPKAVTQEMVELYQRHLYRSRKDDGKPLSASVQRLQLCTVKIFYRWLVKQHYLAISPIETIEMPRQPKPLPSTILSVKEIERVLKQADTSKITGLRDRAMFETLYSTGIRRMELLNLKLRDVDPHHGVLRIEKGKGQKDRVIPIADRALKWIERYLDESRPYLVRYVNEQTLFISQRGGQRLRESSLTKRWREYIAAAGIEKPGAVHIFRHSSATLMLENGADIRHIQTMLGHESLSTTQIYTKVSVKHLKDVHRKTHPSAKS